MLRFSRAVLAAALTSAVLIGPGFSASAWAVSTCATDTDLAAFRTAAVQQQLMVAALTCHDVEVYNRFVLAYQPELQKSDADLKAYFIRRGNEAEYDTFKTKLANLSSLSDIANGPAYCSNAAAAFDMALKSRQALSSFVADQRLMIAMPKQTICIQARPPEPVLEEAAAQQPPIAAPTKAVAVRALPAPASKLASVAPKPRPAPEAESRPQRFALAEPAPNFVAHGPAPRMGEPAEPDLQQEAEVERTPAGPYGRAAPPGTYAYNEDANAAPPPAPYNDEADDAPPPAAYGHDAEDDDLPLPPRPRTAAGRRAEAYYAAQYAAAPSGYRSRWTPSDDDDYYGGR